MRLPDRLTMVGLLLIGWLLCLSNLWYAAARSTIPLAVKGEVLSKRVGVEKHPGVDDVYLLILDRGEPLRIDRELFDKISLGDTLYKVAWQSQVNINDQVVTLKLSPDFYGLLWCMSGALIIMLATVWSATAQPSLECSGAA